MLNSVTAKRIALRALLVSVAVACVIGIIGIYLRDYNKVAFKAMFTSIVLAGACLLAVGCFVAWDQPRARVPSRIGAITSVIAAFLLIAGMWIEPRSDRFWELTGTVSLFAIAGAHASVLWLARLGPRAQWLRTAALVCDVMLVMLLSAAIWDGLRGQAGFQLIAMLSIAEAGVTIAIAAISTVNRTARPGDGVAEVCFCVRCGKPLWMPAGEVRCRHCDEVFFVELRQPSELPSAVLKS
jgi:hypothetical protein